MAQRTNFKLSQDGISVNLLQTPTKYLRKTLVQIAHYWKISISIFKEPFASFDKIFFWR